MIRRYLQFRGGFIALVVVGLLGTSCGGGEEETAPTTTEGEIALTVEAAAESSVDLSKIENQLNEVLEEVRSLKSYFSENADGSVSFVPATIPEVKKDRTYGLAFQLPSTIEPTYTGIASDEATTEEGTLLASAGGVSVLLLWRTDDEPLTPGESVIGSFEVLQQSTGLAFALAGSGQEGFDVDGQTASYATFAATEDAQLIGVALIAGWTCGNRGRSFALTVSGTDQAGVTDSFFALAEGFECGKK